MIDTDRLGISDVSLDDECCRFINSCIVSVYIRMSKVLTSKYYNISCESYAYFSLIYSILYTAVRGSPISWERRSLLPMSIIILF